AQHSPFIDANVRIDARFPFDAELQPLDPFVKLQADAGTLHLGRRSYAVPSAVASLSVSPDASSATLDNGEMWVGEQVFRLSGRFDGMPGDAPETGFGPYAMQLAVEAEKRIAETPAGLQRVDAALSGELDLAALRAVFDRITISGGEAQFAGIGVVGVTEGVSLSLAAGKTDITMVTRLWPDWVAPLAHDWVTEHISGAALSNLDLQLALPPERLAALQGDAALIDSDLSFKT
ncbi:MAG: hypothetical protein KDJ64_12590, partial [Nitratireductor sp.]|nr:hypothetical protein [Nitratireductor sp.]